VKRASKQAVPDDCVRTSFVRSHIDSKEGFAVRESLEIGSPVAFILANSPVKNSRRVTFGVVVDLASLSNVSVLTKHGAIAKPGIFALLPAKHVGSPEALARQCETALAEWTRRKRADAPKENLKRTAKRVRKQNAASKNTDAMAREARKGTSNL
jgi:hypothetical protein